MKYWKIIIYFLFFVVSLGANIYFLFYHENSFYKEKHEQLKIEFDKFKDSIDIEFKILDEERKVSQEEKDKIKADRDKTKKQLEISNNNTKKLLDSIKIGEEKKRIKLQQLDTITNEQADLWIISRFD